MNDKSLIPAVLSLLMLGGLSCLTAQGVEPAPAEPSAPGSRVDEPAPHPTPEAAPGVSSVSPEPEPSEAPVLTPPPAASTPLRAEPGPDITLGAPTPALTVTLDRALDGLTEARAENAKLKETVASLSRVLTDRERTITDLTAQLQQCEATIGSLEAALEKWKQDVLGFREEMRDYEEAEIEVLQEIVLLLKGIEGEKPRPVEAEEPS
ncbi:MAG: hypothetical protein KAX19_12630 [Candidatus Brocadiae bacterium]|nr:hypothetical protein [Candidatus Brocadiia bacterium]